ncbi:hypothetical protein MtrunA17_Chr3g0139791 [Medicago truncatula]|uniref:Structural maintenance of chromosomes protein n=1 Tax=Medicago truncatula TaxID=3880 RepID=A0A396J0C3_MEDTR|nr:hypothetical protein MtrunA17_Chr3g0139791 [Medicago truncatula]
MNLFAERQKVDGQCAHNKSQIEDLKQDIANFNKDKQSFSKALAKKDKSLVDVQNHIEQLKASIDRKKDEMGTDLVDHLTPEEKKLMSELNPEIKAFKEKLVSCKNDRIEVIEGKALKTELETNLRTNLKRRKQDLEAVISSADADSMVVDADSMTLEEEYERKHQEEAKELEELLDKKNSYSAKVEEYTRNIKELGPLTSDVFEMYKHRSIKDLKKRLHKCKDNLQQFSHVNKKALDQYINFTEQREELQKRQAELVVGEKVIKELISLLDQRKDESVERTFKGVASHFRRVFSELVKGGNADLVMMMKKKVCGYQITS